MKFFGPLALSTWAYIAAGTAALAISAYVIKMRRRRFEVPFSQLWRRVLEQKDASALWKQLRRVFSLLLMLAIFGLFLFAALDPTLDAVDPKAHHVVILVDASASMKAMDGDAAGKQSRLDAAKARAKKFVDGMSGGDMAMVVKVDGQATPITRFSNDGPMLDKLIDGITASDTPADLSRALAAAADALRDRPNPRILIVSDGAFPESQLGLASWKHAPPVTAGKTADAKNLAAIDLSGIDVRYLPVGKRSDNVAITAFNVRRYIANKAAYEVLIEIRNFGQEAAHRKLTLYNGSTPVDVKMIDLAAAPKHAHDSELPAGCRSDGSCVVKIYPKIPAGDDNRLRASLQPVDGAGGSDPFALDDTAFALLPAAKKQKVLMVTQDNLYLEAAMLVYDNIDPLKVTPAEYEAKPSLADGMDVVVFDDYTPSIVPPSPTNLMYFHPTGENSPFKVRGEAGAPHVTEIDEGHPVMRWVTLSDVYMDRSDVFAPDNKLGESALAYSVTDPIIVAKRDGKRKIVAFGFSLPAQSRDAATDLPLRVAFPMLFVNALDWFAGDQADLLTTYATGHRERVPLDGVVGATEALVKAPDGTITTTPVLDGLATFYANRVGYYTLTAKDASGRALAAVELAANLASPGESDIAPSTVLALGGCTIAPPGDSSKSCETGADIGAWNDSPTRSQRIWIYLVLLATALIVTEWVTYHRRITV